MIELVITDYTDEGFFLYDIGAWINLKYVLEVKGCRSVGTKLSRDNVSILITCVCFQINDL